jgi:hypothetical protein
MGSPGLSSPEKNASFKAFETRSLKESGVIFVNFARIASYQSIGTAPLERRFYTEMPILTPQEFFQGEYSGAVAYLAS